MAGRPQRLHRSRAHRQQHLYQRFHASSVDDGEPRSVVGYTVAVANSGRYGGGMQLAPDARLDDGLLELVIISDVLTTDNERVDSIQLRTVR